MADDAARDSRFDYKANSNLVLKTDPSLMDKRDKNEATGEVHSLVGKIDTMRMGDRVTRGKKQALIAQLPISSNSQHRQHRQNQQTGSGYYRDEDMENKKPRQSYAGAYQPKSQDTRQSYDAFLSYIAIAIGDHPAEILAGAAEEVLLTLKNSKLHDKKRRNEVEQLLGKLEDARYQAFVNLSKRLTDFALHKDTMEGDETKMKELAEDKFGVNVEFEDDGEDDDEVDDHLDRGLSRFAIEADAEADGDKLLGEKLNSNTLEEENEESMKCDPRDIDAHWVQRKVNEFTKDAHKSQKICEKVLSVLEEEHDNLTNLESRMMDILQYSQFDFVRLVRDNAIEILYCTKLARATESEKIELKKEMKKDPETDNLLKRLESTADVDEKMEKKGRAEDKSGKSAGDILSKKRNMVDLDNMAFEAGSHTMSNKKCNLPDGSSRETQKGFELVRVPAKQAEPVNPDELVPIDQLPKYARSAFEGYKSLNRIQSKIYKTAIQTDENMLICAPTGAGKTNVALLTMLREIGKHINLDGSINKDDFKIIYISPMRSLVQEQTGSFGNRLKSYGIKVSELTGDNQLTREQIEATQVLICTPEKWDIVTRKGTERSYTSLVRLIIIDEVHLLHDERGPVLEAIVARTMRGMNQFGNDHTRIVGLSATLPNYEDVATFLNVDFRKGLFHFDNSYRPVPLETNFIGITERKALHRFQVMNECVYENVVKNAGQNQVLVFVHSRKETVKTAKVLRDMCLDRDTLGMFIKEGSASTEVLRAETQSCESMELKEVLPYGFGVHHAGMSRVDRTLVEDLFADGHIQVLVSTATLAWGVNLPAHSVIIKGTKVYSPDKGKWQELSALDVLQMLGRAGRPQYDTMGEGTLITEHSELQYYLSLMHEQLPIESQMVQKLPDLLCAEVVLGNVNSVKDAADWLSYTYLSVRMLKKPTLYGVPPDLQGQDTPMLTKFMQDLIHTAAARLDKNQLIRYDRASGQLQATELGRISCNFYITYKSMATYNKMLRPHLSEIELFRVFSLSYEFRNIAVRDEEKLELAKLHERVPIPIKESIDEASSKINCLLQAYISQLALDGFALTADMVYVQQSAARIIRALYEIVLSRGWCQLANKLLALSKMVQKRMWQSMCPLRQFRFKQQQEAVKRIEKKNFDFDRCYDLTPTELSELVRMPKMGKIIHKYLHQLPKFELSVHIQPITRSTLKVELSLTPDFQWNDQVHNRSEGFWIFVEDVNSEVILHHEFFILHQRYCMDEHIINFFVPVHEPLPPQYFVRVISDRWLGSETSLAVSFKHLILPEKYLPPTELLDLQPLPASALRKPEYEAVFATRFKYFNPVQTQTFNTLYTTDESCFIGSPGGSGKTVCAELAIMRLFNKTEDGRCVYISPREDCVKRKFELLNSTFAKQLGKNVIMLCGNTSSDLKAISKANVIVSTAENWDILSRRWKQRKHIQRIDLFIQDDIHLIGEHLGPTIEVICSRARYVSQQLERPLRIIALGNSIANGKDIAQWLGVKSSGTYNFHPNSRPLPLDLHIQGFSLAHSEARIQSMSRSMFQAITIDAHASSIVFVPTRRHAKLASLDIVSVKLRKDEEELRRKRKAGLMEDDDEETEPKGFRTVDKRDMKSYLNHITDDTLNECLQAGVGFLHEGSSDIEKNIVEKLFERGAIRVLVVSRALAWSVEARAKVVVVMDTQDYNGKTHTYQDYPITDVLAMISRCGRPLEDRQSRAHILCQMNKKDMFKKFLYDPLPIESHLDHCLHDHFNAEIVTKTVETKQDAVDYLTWTLLYRRMCQNPNYYNMHGSTHRHLSDSLSELVENTLSDLVTSKCISIEEDQDISPMNLGMIAAYYYISYTTIELFSMSLHSKTKTRGMLEILSAASEFENVPIRQTDVIVLEQLNSRVPYRPAAAGQQIKYYDPHVKTHLLMQSHMSRLELPAELQQDNDICILPVALRLVQAAVDVLSSNGWLTAALSAMDLSQMLTQAVWPRDGHLKQLPHFSADMISKAKQSEVESVFDVLEMEDEDRLALLKLLSERQMGDVANFCNGYPNVELQYEPVQPEKIDDDDEDSDDSDAEEPGAKKKKTDDEDDSNKPYVAGVAVQLTRDEEEEDDIVTKVEAPFWPADKEQGWWLLVGNVESNHLVSIKRINFVKGTQANLNWQVDDAKAGETRKYTLYFICDSYTGCDQEYEFELKF